MPGSILDTDNDILKMLIFDPESDAVTLKISGKNPARYQVTPMAMLDEALLNCPPDHLDALLDARNYLYKKDAADV
jgi:hypothetical protein